MEQTSLSESDIIAILWHQHEIKSFETIASLTLAQLTEILGRQKDDHGKIELFGDDPEDDTEEGSEDAASPMPVSFAAPEKKTLTSYQDILRHSIRLWLTKEMEEGKRARMTEEELLQEIERQLVEREKNGNAKR